MPLEFWLDLTGAGLVLICFGLTLREGVNAHRATDAHLRAIQSRRIYHREQGRVK